jgi:hypothetical protein
MISQHMLRLLVDLLSLGLVLWIAFFGFCIIIGRGKKFSSWSFRMLVRFVTAPARYLWRRHKVPLILVATGVFVGIYLTLKYH